MKSKTRQIIKPQHKKYIDYGLNFWMAKDNAEDYFKMTGAHLTFHMRNMPTAYATGRYLSSLNYIENVNKRNAAWKIDVEKYEQEVI